MKKILIMIIFMLRISNTFASSCIFNNNDESVQIKCPSYNFVIFKKDSNCSEIIDQTDGSLINRFYSNNSILEDEYDEYNVLIDRKLIKLDNSRKTCVTLYKKAKKYINKQNKKNTNSISD